MHFEISDFNKLIESEKLNTEPKSREKSIIDELSVLYMEAYRGMEEYGEPSLSHAKKYIKWLMRHSDFFKVLISENRFIGFIACSSDWFWNGRVGEIHEICIDPDFRKRGLGKFLVNLAVDFFSQKNLKRAGLWVGEKNEVAIKFYKSLGFEFSGDRFPNWLRMEKEI